MSKEDNEDRIIYSPNHDAKPLHYKEGMVLIQKIIDVISPYNLGTGRNALCFSLVVVLSAIDEEQAVKDSLQQIIEMYLDGKKDDGMMRIPYLKNETKQ